MIKNITLAVNSQIYPDFGKAKGVFYSLFPLDYRSLPRETENINICGAEPFLRDDLYKIVRVISFSCPEAKISISTTGFSPVKIKKQMEQIARFKKDVGIEVHMDGYGKTHEEINNSYGGFALALETVRVLKEMGIINLRVIFSLNGKNTKEIKKVYRLAKEMGVNFALTIKPGVSLKKPPALLKELHWVMNQELKTFSIKRWKNAYLIWALYCFIYKKTEVLGGKEEADSFSIDSYGNVYSKFDWRLRLDKFRKITDWDILTQKAEELADSFKKRQPSWEGFIFEQAVQENSLKVYSWILVKKLSILERAKNILEKTRELFGLKYSH